MEEEEKKTKEQNENIESTASEPVKNPTSEPAITARRRKKDSKLNKKLLIFIIIGILIVIGVVFLLKEPNIEVEPTQAPTETPVQEQNPTPTETPEPIDKENISIQVLNGTGISGQAGYLKDQLQSLGYSDVEVGNADEQDYEETQVTYSSSLDDRVKQELTDRLKTIYEDVKEVNASLGGYDIVIIAGLRKGQVLPTDTPTAAPTKSVTPTPTGTPSPTPTGTPSPTPTS